MEERSTERRGLHLWPFRGKTRPHKFENGAPKVVLVAESGPPVLAKPAEEEVNIREEVSRTTIVSGKWKFRS